MHLSQEHHHALVQITDPTTIVLIDEADRLKMAALEQVRDIFDHGGIGVVFIGTPGIEKRLSWYPQLYSRVGFVHAFRPLSVAQVRELLQQQWLPSGVALPKEGVTDEEALAAIIRVTGAGSDCSTGSSRKSAVSWRSMRYKPSRMKSWKPRERAW